MDIEDINIESFFKKITYISDPNPGNKLVISNEAFIQCAIQLRLIRSIDILRGAMK